MQGLQECTNCSITAKCRRRDFSEQAWSVLLVWGEVDASVVDEPICDDCYKELREILIDRADEIIEALRQPEGKVKKIANKKDLVAKSVKAVSKKTQKKQTKVA